MICIACSLQCTNNKDDVCDICHLGHCKDHRVFDKDCYWCLIAHEGVIRMTDTEIKVHLGILPNG